LSKYSDTYTKELEKLIDSKVKGKPIVEKPMEKMQETQDLVAALKASLQQKTKVRTKR
jgi:non-homologous end joining protein Ku